MTTEEFSNWFGQIKGVVIKKIEEDRICFECLEEMLSISLKELSNKIALKEKDIYRIKKSTFEPLLKPKDTHEILEDGMLGIWDYNSKQYLRNNKNQIWSRSDGSWIGVYLPSEDRIDDEESEPDCDEDASIRLLEYAIYTYTT